jgi:hypothetical protein
MQWRIENWFGEWPVFICIPTASLEPTDRINYRRSVVINGIAHDYIVVVVTEKAFPSFIESLETECDRIALAIHKKRKLFKAAQRKICGHHRGRSPKCTSYCGFSPHGTDCGSANRASDKTEVKISHRLARSSAQIRVKPLHAGCAGGSQRQKILRPADRLAHATEQLLQVSVALHEIDVIGVHYQQV